MKRDRIWTKDFIVLLASNFFVSLSFYLLLTSMAVYAMKYFHATKSSAGLAASIFVIGALAARLYAGKFIDVVGRKKMLYSGLGLFFAGSMAYLFVTGIGCLMLIRFVHGVGFGISTTVLTTANMSTLPPSRRGEGIGYFSLSNAAGTAIGPFFALYLVNHFGYSMMFIFSIIFSSFALILGVMAKITEIDLSHEEKEKIKRSFGMNDFYEKKAFPVAFLMFIGGIAYSGIVSFINSYAIQMNLSHAASYFFVVYALFLFLIRPVAGKLFDQKGENIVMYPSFLFFAVSLLCITMARTGFLLLLAGILLAMGYGTLMSSVQTIVGKVSPPHRLGLGISTFYICMDSGMGIGPYILGLIAEGVGFQVMYIMLAVAVFCLIPAYYLVHGKKAGIERV
ncbi:MAG TPA: MFS transporter [Bacillota bacterium]|nr:MFS transporter [Bacillota bacterium]HPT87911.1 MFS transporter [Bacillota bacterium]